MMLDKATVVKYLRDAIPSGERRPPHATWIDVRLDVVQAAASAIEGHAKNADEGLYGPEYERRSDASKKAPSIPDAAEALALPDCLEVLAARLSDKLSPAEKRELAQAAAAIRQQSSIGIAQPSSSNAGRRYRRVILWRIRANPSGKDQT